MVSRQVGAQNAVLAPDHPSVHPLFESSQTAEDVPPRAETLHEEQPPLRDEPEPASAELEVDFSLDDESKQAAVEGELSPNELDLEFDLSEPEAQAPPSTAPEPLPLDLAEEFRAIGDEDGARALIEEVIESASGDMKARAERALGKLK